MESRQVVVTGASRGIGLALVRELLERGDRVLAAVHHPESARELNELVWQTAGRIRVLPCDVARDESVAAFAAALGERPVDLLINNAGVPPYRDTIDRLEPGDRMVEKLNVNAVGPLRVAHALLPNLRRSRGRTIVNISSALGSIGETDFGDSFGYRMSKAALNMASRALAQGLRPERIVSVVIHPGWVRTKMGGPRAPISAEESAARILALIDRLTLRQSGSFLDYKGHVLHW